MDLITSPKIQAMDSAWKPRVLSQTKVAASSLTKTVRHSVRQAKDILRVLVSDRLVRALRSECPWVLDPTVQFAVKEEISYCRASGPSRHLLWDQRLLL